MEKELFITKFADALEMDSSELTLDTEFRKLSRWDSLAYLSVIAMLDAEFDVQIEQAKFKTLITIGDIFNECLKK